MAPTRLQNLASPDTDPSAVVKRDEAVAEALQIVLQVMSPSERAAFLLHDVFGFRHAEVATVLHRSESAVRQIVHRARVRARAREPRFSVSSNAHAELEHVFSQASRNTPAAFADLRVLSGFSTFLRTRPQIGLNLADFGSICGLVRRNVAYAGRPSGLRTGGRRSR